MADSRAYLINDLKELWQYGGFKNNARPHLTAFTQVINQAQPFDYETIKNRFLAAIYTCLNPEQAEILLVSYGLLPDYENIGGVEERREIYGVRNGVTTKTAGNRGKAAIEILATHLMVENYSTKPMPDILKQSEQLLARYAIGQHNKELVGANFPPNNLPFWRDDYFVGRASQLEHILSTFREGKNIVITQTITGLGGVGKTQLAFKYAYEYACQYDAVCWINAASDITAMKSIQDFLISVKVPEAQAESGIRLRAFHEWVENKSNWLLVLDNVDDFEEIKPYLPKNKEVLGNILITTRLQHGFALIRNGEKIDVSVFSKAEAVSFLLLRTGLTDEENALKLARRLGYLPLALEQAGAYISEEHNNVDIAGYLGLLDKHGLLMLKKNENIIDYKESVAATWKISVKDITRPSAKQLLNMIAYFSADDIPILLFIHFCGHLPEPLRSDMQNELDVNEIMGELTKYSLVKRNGDYLSIHRLLQEVIVDNTKDDEVLRDCLSLASDVCAMEFEGQLNGFMFVAHHINVLHKRVEDLQRTDEFTDMLLTINTALAGYFLAIRDYDQSILANKFLIENYKKMGKLNSKEALLACLRMIQIFAARNEYDALLPFCLTAQFITAALDGIKGDEYATSLEATAGCLHSMGECKKALACIKRAIRIKKKIWGPSHQRTLFAMLSALGIYNSLGKEQKTRKFTHEIQRRWEEASKRDDQGDDDHFGCWHNYAILCIAIGRFDEALEWSRKIFRFNAETLGPAHHDTLSSTGLMAEIFFLKGDYQQALEIYEPLVRYFLVNTNGPNEQTKLIERRISDCKEFINNAGLCGKIA